jgi:type III restriction enzyme
LAVYERTTNQQAALDNPQEFAAGAVRILKQALTEQLVAGIRYERRNDWYAMELFAEEIPGWMDNLVPAEGSLYDQVSCDSQIERDFVSGLERRDDVKLYVKLPAWFTVQTPIGEYNPDWAIVMEDRDEHGDGRERLYLVRETKSTTERAKLRMDERHKLFCGERHFTDALGVDYRVVTTAGELP